MERRTVIYEIIIALLVVGLVVIGVLILRKRAGMTIPPAVSSTPAAVRKLPTDTKPYASIPRAVPWKEGDPVPPATDFKPTFPEQLATSSAP